MTEMEVIPRLENRDGKWRLMVDGKPFLVLGGQAHNSSGNNPEDLARVFDSLEALHANTALIPIYWELVEPKPGQFDFSTLREILAIPQSRINAPDPALVRLVKTARATTPPNG